KIEGVCLDVEFDSLRGQLCRTTKSNSRTLHVGQALTLRKMAQLNYGVVRVVKGDSQARAGSIRGMALIGVLEFDTQRPAGSGRLVKGRGQGQSHTFQRRFDLKRYRPATLRHDEPASVFGRAFEALHAPRLVNLIPGFCRGASMKRDLTASLVVGMTSGGYRTTQNLRVQVFGGNSGMGKPQCAVQLAEPRRIGLDAQ